MSTTTSAVAGYFPAEIMVSARDLKIGDVLPNGDLVAEVRPTNLFPNGVFIRFEIEGMSSSIRVPGSFRYRVTRQFAVAADWSIIEQPAELAVQAIAA